MELAVQGVHDGLELVDGGACGGAAEAHLVAVQQAVLPVAGLHILDDVEAAGAQRSGEKVLETAGVVRGASPGQLMSVLLPAGCEWGLMART